jgi:hypothetical protein
MGVRPRFFRNLLAITALAFFAGLAGGLTSRLLTPDRTALRVGTVRARRIEWINVTGKVSAFIGTDDQRDTAIVLDEKMRNCKQLRLR